jgi:ATP-binding cassette subfamily C (CFTR/MRP) protein 1
MYLINKYKKINSINSTIMKSLRLSTSARKLATVGEMTNLIAINAQSFADLTTYLNILWSAPFQIIVSIIGLWKYLGNNRPRASIFFSNEFI